MPRESASNVGSARIEACHAPRMGIPWYSYDLGLRLTQMSDPTTRET